jgi:hypothetical protein
MMEKDREGGDAFVEQFWGLGVDLGSITNQTFKKGTTDLTRMRKAMVRDWIQSSRLVGREAAFAMLRQLEKMSNIPPQGLFLELASRLVQVRIAPAKPCLVQALYL